ncbi:histidine kinase [Algoriphagus sp. SE2]|uniref:histidine kinase n=1 Tax=Algoriphagus sp. SE2 TaxID=3141536 RepID=UPI0031CD741B
MDSRFSQIYLEPYFILINLLLIIGLIFFFRLNKDERTNIYYWLPFLILTFTVVYEDFAGYLVYNYELNKWVNEILGNEKNPNYNVWFYNFANKYIATALYLFLIKTWLEPAKKKYITWMIFFYFFVILFLTGTGIEPVYLGQPIIFAIGANMILVGSGLYFIGLISNEKYLESNPLRLLSFWQMTFILFTYSLTYISSVSVTYLYSVNKQLGMSLFQIDWVMGVLNLSILVLTIASPKLPGIFEKEPYYAAS